MPEIKIALFGPPGIGKSTIASRLISIGERGLDMESVHFLGESPGLEIIPIIGQGDGYIIVSCAGLPHTAGQFMGFTTVLLAGGEKAYAGRRKRRDARISNRAVQPEHKIQDWVDASQGDYIVDAMKLDVMAWSTLLVEVASTGDLSLLEAVSLNGESQSSRPEVTPNEPGLVGTDHPQVDVASQAETQISEPSNSL